MSNDVIVHTYKPLEELIEDFGYLDDWEDRYAYLIDIGKELPGLSDEEKIEDNRVKGCTSQIWLVHRKKTDTNHHETHHFYADSDAFIVRGLVSIVLSAFSGKTFAEIEQIDLSKIFTQIGLERNLSVSRRNGFASMIQRVKSLASS